MIHDRLTMIFQAFLFVALIGSIFAQGPIVEIEPKGPTPVRLGQDLEIRCRVAMPLTYCRVQIGNNNTPLVIHDPSKIPAGHIKYIGRGLDKGECYILIRNIKESYDGNFTCSVFTEGNSYEGSAFTKIVIAKPPQRPELILSRGSTDRPHYKRGEQLEISCIARGGRPNANLSLYLDDEKLNEDRLNYYQLNENDLDRIEQNVSRSLDWTDHGREVRCIATHIALDRPMETKVKLDVHYPPQPQSTGIIKRFGYVIGQKGVVNVTINANPRPAFTWIVNGEEIQAGHPDSTNRIETSSAYESGNGKWTAILTIDSVQKSDTEKEYHLRATNDEGTYNYEVKISTSSEPPGVDLDAGSIIGIVIGVVLLILAVFLVVFARATGRWCFAGRRTSRNIGESDIADPAVSVNLLRFHKPKTDDASRRRSDTESAGRYSRSEVDSSSGRRRRPKITFSQLFKRNKDKVSGADTDTMRTNVTVDDEKLQTVEQTTETGKTSEGGLVYAELDLTQQQQQQGENRRLNDDKTEYAEILYTKPETEEQTPDK